MTDPASAPPPMDKGYWRKLGKRDGFRWTITWLHNRAKSMNDPKATAILNSAAFSLGNEIREGRMPSIPEDRDGWNAALAAQPPEPAPQTAAEMTREVFQNWTTRRQEILREKHQPHESPPPQPGDAEKLAEIGARLKSIGDSIGGVWWAASDVRLLWKTIDAAQSALAASQENIRLLEKAHASNNQALSDTREELAAEQKERQEYARYYEGVCDEKDAALAASQAEVARLREEAAELTTTAYAMGASDRQGRLRSPAATGEDREALAESGSTEFASALEYVNKTCGPAIRYSIIKEITRLRDERAAARAQGVREGIERCIEHLCRNPGAHPTIVVVGMLRSLSPEGVREGAEKMRALDEAVIEAARKRLVHARHVAKREDGSAGILGLHDLAIAVALAARDAALTEEAERCGHEKTGAGDLAG